VELTRAATVRKWVALYQAHGDAGLSGKYDHYDATFKLKLKGLAPVQYRTQPLNILTQ